MSEGNGHPYSWAAICNGYDKEAMSNCPFPAIPEYLGREKYPESFLDSARVTHVWTQDSAISNEIANASKIPHVVDRLEAMLGHVDAILLARDDAHNHIRFAEPFLRESIPVFVDKPLALSRKEALRLFSMAAGTKLFTCSALRFAPELKLSPRRRRALGRIQFIDAHVPNSWEKYAVHVIEPILQHFPEADEISSYQRYAASDVRYVSVRWRSGLVTRFSALGPVSCAISYTVYGDKGTATLTFRKPFAAFRSALSEFVKIVGGSGANIPTDFTLKVVDIIELGTRGNASDG